MKIYNYYLAFVMFLFCTANVMAQPKAVLLTTDAKKQIVDTIAKQLKDNYIFADTARRMSRYIETRLKTGAYDTIQNEQVFAKTLTDDIQSIYHDGHFSVRYSPQMAEDLTKGRAKNEHDLFKMRQEFGRNINYGFNKAEILDGNIGYIKLDGFWGIENESKQTVNAALAFVSHCKVLIFDLRNNHGGDPAMVSYIAGFLFKDKTHLNDLYERKTNHLQSFWTSPDTSFRPLFNVPVYILTGKTTFSAGEEFTYDLQAQKRAIVIGATTGGGAHPVAPHAAGYGFVVNIPFARAINPITKTNWETTGVKPDIQVDPDQALETALNKIKSASNQK